MSEHSVAETEKALTERIERLLSGERVVITLAGKPAVELRPLERPLKIMTQDDWDELDARLPKLSLSETVDGGALIREMRDEGP